MRTQEGLVLLWGAPSHPPHPRVKGCGLGQRLLSLLPHEPPGGATLFLRPLSGQPTVLSGGVALSVAPPGMLPSFCMDVSGALSMEARPVLAAPVRSRAVAWTCQCQEYSGSRDDDHAIAPGMHFLSP